MNKDELEVLLDLKHRLLMLEVFITQKGLSAELSEWIVEGMANTSDDFKKH